jgi:hypothetical protein
MRMRSAHRLRHLPQFVPRQYACMLTIVDRHGFKRGGRAVIPDRIDRIGVDRNQRTTLLGKRFLQSLHVRDRMQPGIKPDPHPLACVRRKPFRRWRGDQIDNLKHARIELLPRLHRIAPVDEHISVAFQHQSDASRPGKPRQPSQPFGALGHIFALMFIAARHQKPVNAMHLKKRPQLRNPGRGEGWIG